MVKNRLLFRLSAISVCLVISVNGTVLRPPVDQSKPSPKPFTDNRHSSREKNVFLFAQKKSSDNSNHSDENYYDAPANYNHSASFRNWLSKTMETYDNRLRPWFGGRPLKIKLGMLLTGISSVSEANMDFTVEMFFHETWTDNRLRFVVADVGGRNPLTLPLEAPRIFWVPDTSFLNARRSSVPEIGSVSHMHYMKLFNNGTISYSRRLSVTAECRMDLTMYPFDRQACTMELSSYGSTVDDIIYEWSLNRHSVDLNNLTLPDFKIIRYMATVINRTYAAGDFSVPKLCIELERRSGFCFLQLFVPATAVVASSWISLWLESETQFADMVAVILAIIFLSYSYNTVMPKVSYIKAMDIYLGACFIFAFLSLVKLAIVKYMGKRVKKHKELVQAGTGTTATLVQLPTGDGDNGLSNHEERVLLLSSGGYAPDSVQSTPIRTKKSPSSSSTLQIRRMTTTTTLASMSSLDSAVQHNQQQQHHDRYWRCMKMFHIASQLTLPLAFGAFGIFYFFIYPHMQKEIGVCH